MDQILSDFYHNVESPVAYTGANRLYKAAKSAIPGLTLRKVRTWLSQQPAYSLHKLVKRKFPHNRIVVPGIKYQYQADLADVSQVHRSNGGTRYLLTCIDVFSKYAWAVPLKSKESTAVTNAFKVVLADGAPRCLQTDKGREFLGRPFQELLRRNSIRFYTATNPDIKCSVVERFNRTLRARIARYQTHRDTDKFIDVLPQIVRAYNHTLHRSINCRPVDVSKENEMQVWSELYGRSPNRAQKRHRLALGDQVRLARGKGTFGRGYVLQWTDELFSIVSRRMADQPTYTVQDFDGNVISGFFYEPELQLINKA